MCWSKTTSLIPGCELEKSWCRPVGMSAAEPGPELTTGPETGNVVCDQRRDESSVAKTLTDLGVCTSCVFHFSELEEPVDGASTADGLERKLLEQLVKPEAQSYVASRGVVCPMCMGALQFAACSGSGMYRASAPAPPPSDDGLGGSWSSAADGKKEAIAAAIRQQGFESETFTLRIGVPAQTVWRIRSLRNHIDAQTAPCQTAKHRKALNTLLDLKNPLQKLLVPTVESATGWRHDPRSQVHIDMSFCSDADAELMDNLAAMRRKVSGQGTKRKWQEQGQQQRPLVAATPLGYEAVRRMVESLTRAEFQGLFPATPQPCQAACQVYIRVRRAPVLVGGRYVKLRRGLSQSPWGYADGEEKRQPEGSVQEVLEAAIGGLLAPEGCKFITAGREDYDVRMLGDGRPFALLLNNCKRPNPTREACRAIEQQLRLEQAGVEVVALQPVAKLQLPQLTEGEREKKKSYRAVCWARSALADEQVALLTRDACLTIQQSTPTRVMQRRANMEREKLIHSLRCQPLEQDRRYFVLQLCTQAGTYVKEFVHGDFGRTAPSVRQMLGCEVQILQLDVTAVHLAWPPEDSRPGPQTRAPAHEAPAAPLDGAL